MEKTRPPSTGIRPSTPHEAPVAPKIEPPRPSTVGPLHRDTTIPAPTANPPRPDLTAFRQGFSVQADAIGKEIANLRWYQKLPGLSSKPELMKQQALHTEAAQHVRSLEEATLADALINLPPKNRPQSIQKALEMTRAGQALLPEVVSGARAKTDATPERVAQLQWALYNKAVQQLESQAVQKGSRTREQLVGGMTVLDDGGKVAEFMQGVPRTGTGTGSYTRPSSHFKETRDSSLGMDFTDPNIPLPAGKHTILYGTKDAGTSSYLKNEYSGFDTYADRFGHIFDFIKTNVLGQRDVGRREKFIPESVKQLYEKLDGPPLDAKKLKAEGIAYMIRNLPEKARSDFANFVTSKGYNKAEMRKGEEIIIPRSDLIPPSREEAQKGFARDLSAIQRTVATHQEAAGTLTPLEEGLQHAFGTGVKPSTKFAEAFKELRSKDPKAAQLALDVMRDPTRRRVEDFFMNWSAKLEDAAKLSKAAKTQLTPLAATIFDQYMQTNTQFAEDHSAHNFSEPGKPLFPREVSARQKYADFIATLPSSDPRKQAAQKLVEAAAKEGFNLQLTAYNTDPYLSIARGQDIVAGVDGFRSAIGMQQGDRAAYRVDHLDLPGADTLSRQEKENIFRLLKNMEGPKSEADRLEAFDKDFDKFKLEGSTYLNDAKRLELKGRLAQFARARDESVQSIFKTVTGHDEFGRSGG